MSQHSEGEWIVLLQSYVRRERATPMVAIDTGHGHHILASASGAYGSEVTQANVHLMAAAPKLLAAGKLARRALRDIEKEWPNTVLDEVECLEAAIAATDERLP